MAADRHVLAYHRERSDRRAFPDARRFRHGGQRMNAGLRLRRLIEKLERASEIEIRVRRNQAGNGQTGAAVPTVRIAAARVSFTL